MSQEEILHRYRHLRAISVRHHSGALDCLARPAILEHARHLGLAHGQTLVAESQEKTMLIFDLAVHTARSGRSRAIDRYAKAAALASGSEDAKMLEAICQARFSIWRIERRHDVAGVIAADMLHERETWLIDEGLAASFKPGMMIAGRLCWPEDFAMTCGVVVPVNAELICDILLDRAAWLRSADRAADDPRFATVIYRAVLESGMMDRVMFKETALAS